MLYSRGRWRERTRQIGGERRERWGVGVCVCMHICVSLCVCYSTDPWGEDLVIEITTDCHAHSQKLENNPSDKNVRRT